MSSRVIAANEAADRQQIPGGTRKQPSAFGAPEHHVAGVFWSSSVFAVAPVRARSCFPSCVGSDTESPARTISSGTCLAGCRRCRRLCDVPDPSWPQPGRLCWSRPCGISTTTRGRKRSASTWQRSPIACKVCHTMPPSRMRPRNASCLSTDGAWNAEHVLH